MVVLVPPNRAKLQPARVPPELFGTSLGPGAGNVVAPTTFDSVSKFSKYVPPIYEAGPAADGVLQPPWYEEGETDLFGYTMEETRAYAMKALERRMKVIGLAPVA